eukprot:13436705-Alexandrium_andersonii.AAC.1
MTSPPHGRKRSASRAAATSAMSSGTAARLAWRRGEGGRGDKRRQRATHNNQQASRNNARQ